MSEKRRADVTLLIRFKGNSKSTKVELFKASQWGFKPQITERYRMRKNGKWWPENEKRFFSITQVKELMFQGLYRHLR